MAPPTDRQEEKLDRALKDTFPASDPPAASIPATADRLPDGVFEVADDRHPTKADDNQQGMPQHGRRRRELQTRETHGVEGTSRSRNAR
jgi:hypothetical protein